MVWIVLTGVAGFLIIRFLYDLFKDRFDLGEGSLSDKFSHIVNLINQAAFDGQGQINKLAKNEFNLHKKGGNQIVYFIYGAGSLTIVWKFSYLNTEVIHKERFSDVREITTEQQEIIANGSIKGMRNKISSSQITF